MKIEEKIRMIREIKGISQEAVATHLDITPQAYGKIERGETKLVFDRINEISRYLEVSIEDVVSFDEKDIFSKTLGSKSAGNFRIEDSKEEYKIIERLLITIESRFDKYDILLDKNLEIIEKFGELMLK